MDYPYSGELFPAKNKKFEELIFFVPFFEGKKAQIKKHIDFVNELGFDAFAFHLWEIPLPEIGLPSIRYMTHPLEQIQSIPQRIRDYSLFSSTGEFGLRHIYADQIEALLNLFPQPKIIYAFSNPSVGAMKAMSQRHCTDIRGLVCDSGPSSKFVRSVSNLTSQQKYPHQKAKSLATSLMMSGLWGLKVEEDLDTYLKSFPKNFPILSIRGWKDTLISPDDIDGVFQTHDNLNWTKLSLPEAGHLNGLRDFASEYKPAVTKFLTTSAKAPVKPPGTKT